MKNDSSTELAHPAPNDFGTLIAPHRRVLLAHCYRMLGSLTEAEDAFQDALVRAWQAHPQFEGRAAIRTWLYRIATNACLTLLEKRRRRSIPEFIAPAVRDDEAVARALEESHWIGPYPDAMVEAPDVEAVAKHRESVALAFVVALQHLPPRQRAILLLRDVVGYEATEVADMIKASLAAVNSALSRARATLAAARQPNWSSGPAALDAGQEALLKRYVEAWQARDVDSLVALLAEEASFSMPPVPAWYQGHPAITGVLRGRVFAQERRFRLHPTVANGQPAFAVYKAERDATSFSAHGIQLVSLGTDSIQRVITFLTPRLVTAFGLPAAADSPG